MNRKRRDDREDWFHGGDWNIEDIFNNLDGEFQKMRKQMDSLMRDALEGNMSDNANKNPFVFGFSVCCWGLRHFCATLFNDLKALVFSVVILRCSH